MVETPLALLNLPAGGFGNGIIAGDIVDTVVVGGCVVVTGCQDSIAKCCLPDDTGNCDMIAFNAPAGFGGIGTEF